MNDPRHQARVHAATYTGTASSTDIDDDARRVLRNTWNLLAMTLLFSAGTAALSMSQGWSHPGILITLVGYFGLLFLTMALRNSAWGLVSVFALTGFMGLTLGPIISSYISVFSNGSELVISAFTATAVAFVALSAFAVTTKKDFSFMGSFLFAGILVAFLAGLGAYFFQLPALSLAVSAIFAVLMCGLILFQTQQIVRGGERNYIMATVTLFVSIYNLFTSLLHLFGFAFGED
ncbi:Bax inhibitor-1/YccA family protein [Wenzhouxiangella sp. XN79A]|uniref:Bax inhibitor-1/YccA family protein n=1 Tax=Wenzhouxiangella sp. XN79A TaxID=2724193 RepID=UPI00144A52F8|nr:Bax inhibitor-1/YccA family protein [Wenzhouxiangella sp. XN79A]NKI35990.1 Bax inhibitor-1/YccA family protein [Wenzhouxiangella sp. XN79A]